MNRTLPLALAFALGSLASATTLDVGPGKPFTRPEEALARAQVGDTIRVYPLAEGKPYAKVALQVRTPELTIQAVPAKDGGWVRFDGEGFDYHGAGRTPRAIVQFDPAASGGTLDGFELVNAHNADHNGAGVRINQANRVTIRRCDIHGNDMGIMSNGEVAASTGAQQRIAFCRIHANGSTAQPGQNHNLYLGGSSVLLCGCEVFGSLTGHNVKSRAHDNRIEYCFVHDSANREFDLVDARGNTDIPDSHSVLIGNLIVKKSNIDGNKAVIHFGQDGKAGHQGTLYLVHNTILTPYAAPVVDLSSAEAGALLINNLVWDRDNGRHLLAAAGRNGATLGNFKGSFNCLAPGFTFPDTMDVATNRIAAPGEAPSFAAPNRGDWRPLSGAAVVDKGMPWDRIQLPAPPDARAPAAPLKLMEYVHPLRVEPRRDDGKPDLGAFEAPLKPFMP